MQINDDTPTAALLEIIGWSPGVLSQKLEVNLRTAQRWATGQNETPDNIREWLIHLAYAHLSHLKPSGWNGPCRV